jgi:hypothetical protein
MNEDHAWEEPTRPPASSNAKAMHPSGTRARNQLIDANRGQKGTERSKHR